MESHTLCKLFPSVSEDELLELAADIEANGVLEPIVVHEGQVLDGKNRLRACGLAKVEPHFVEYRGSDPLGFVVAKNMRRRHLTISQRAMLANRIVSMRQGQRSDLALPADLRKVSQAAAAELMDVSLRAVQAAAVVTDKGTPEEVDRVLSGQEAVTRAEKAIRDKEKEIREAAKANPSRFGDLAAQLDKKDAKVDPIHRELKKREKADTKKADVMQDANGTTVPDHLRDVWGDPWIAQVAEALEEVARDILPKALKKVEGKGGRYRFILSSEIMKALATAIEEVKVAHGQLTKNKPHAVCPDCGGESAAKKGAGKCDSCRSGGILPEWRYREIKKGRK